MICVSSSPGVLLDMLSAYEAPLRSDRRRGEDSDMTDSDYSEIRLHDGRILAYSKYGSPRGLPIIHCHGTPSSRVEGNLIFDPAMAAELGVRIIVPDRPGMGRSDFSQGGRIVDWPEDVLELAAALGLDTVRGARIVRRLALRGRVRRADSEPRSARRASSAAWPR